MNLIQQQNFPKYLYQKVCLNVYLILESKEYAAKIKGALPTKLPTWWKSHYFIVPFFFFNCKSWQNHRCSSTCSHLRCSGGLLRQNACHSDSIRLNWRLTTTSTTACNIKCTQMSLHFSACLTLMSITVQNNGGKVYLKHYAWYITVLWFKVVNYNHYLSMLFV